MRPEWIIQIGLSRDAGLYFTTPAHDLGYKILLVESVSNRPLFERARLLGGPAFDEAIWTPDSRHETVVDAVQEFAEDHRVLKVIPGFELFSLTAARAAERLGLDTPNTAEQISRFRRKDLQRRHLREMDPSVRQPRFMVCPTKNEVAASVAEIGFPCVLKVADSGGSQGVLMIRSQKDLSPAIDRVAGVILDDGTTSAGILLVEEFVGVKEVGLQGVVDLQGRVQLYGITSKSLYHGPNGDQFLERRLVASGSARIPPELSRFACRAIEALELRASPFHVDVRIDEYGPAFIETGARLSGGFIPLLLAEANGWSPGRVVLEAWLGSCAPLPGSLDRICGQEFLNAPTPGGPALFGFQPPQTRPSEKAMAMMFVCQDMTGGYSHVSDRIGVIRAVAGGEKRVHQLLDACLAGITIGMTGVCGR